MVLGFSLVPPPDLSLELFPVPSVQHANRQSRGKFKLHGLCIWYKPVTNPLATGQGLSVVKACVLTASSYLRQSISE